MENLYDIAKKYGADKGDHGYTTVYSSLFEPFRLNSINLFEIGVCEGRSLKMWEEYFPNGIICGMDIGESGNQNYFPVIIKDRIIRSLNIGRIKTFIGDQNKRDDLKKAMNFFNIAFDIIVDDGSHFQASQQIGLGFLFEKYLKSCGFYIIEDIGTFWNLKHGSDWGIKDKENLTDCTCVVLENYLKTRKINSPYMLKSEINYLEKNIESLTLYPPKQERRRSGPPGPSNPDSPILGSSMIAVIRKK